MKASSDSPETVVVAARMAVALSHLSKGIKKGYVLTRFCKHDDYSGAFSRMFISLATVFHNILKRLRLNFIPMGGLVKFSGAPAVG